MTRRSRTRDLAGLAALGALGYMAMRGDKQAPAPVEDRSTMPMPEADAATGARVMGADIGDTGDFLSRRLRINPETGEAYSTDNLSPMRAARAAALSGGASARSPINNREQVFDAPMVARRDPNISAEVARRTGVRLDSRAGAGRGGQGGPTAAELEAYRSRPYTPPPMSEEMRRQAERQAIAPVYPEEYLAGGPGLRAAHSAARALANRPRTLATSPSAAPALPAPQARLTGPSKADLMARDRAAREATRREEMLRENAEVYGLNPNAPGYEAAARALRERLGGSEFTLRKKGGAIKAKAKPKKMASGGMSSASKRADGIASKGKTKCKMY